MRGRQQARETPALSLVARLINPSVPSETRLIMTRQIYKHVLARSSPTNENLDH